MIYLILILAGLAVGFVLGFLVHRNMGVDAKKQSEKTIVKLNKKSKNKV